MKMSSSPAQRAEVSTTNPELFRAPTSLLSGAAILTGTQPPLPATLADIQTVHRI